MASNSPCGIRRRGSIPELNGDANKEAVAVINPRPSGHATIETLFSVDDCNPAGLALGPHQHLLLGCSLKNGQSVIMDARNGHIVKVVHGVGGSDEVWFNKGDDRYYLAARNNVNELGKVVPALGIIDARTNELLAAIPTGTPVKASTSAHSVAADRILNHVFVPLPPLVGDAHCANGCIGVYWSEDEDEE